MKRGRTDLKAKRQTFSSQEERAKRQKWGQKVAPVEDWGNLPHHVVLQIFQHLSLVDRARASSVCRCWNDVFHTPDLWRRFEFELNQPATSYLRSTHPDLIQQIIKKHAQHLQYVSFKVSLSPRTFTPSSNFMCALCNLHHLLQNWRISCLGIGGFSASKLRLFLHLHHSVPQFFLPLFINIFMNIFKINK